MCASVKKFHQVGNQILRNQLRNVANVNKRR